MTAPVVRVLGIRHHGPGSARAVLAALTDLQPDRVLIEGPPEADGLVAFATEPDLVPPVALLAYRNDDPAASAFWPFAVFSPEWQAMSWAAHRGVPVSFMDLPAGVLLGGETPDPHAVADAPTVRTDPIAVLARVAGHDDPERWWEDVIETRRDGDPFDALTEAMTAVRADRPETDRRTLQREAHMRKILRARLKAGSRRIAVVCGAWHAPALVGKLPGATADNALLRGLATARVTVTWVPWTHSRLAASSGYGAGVGSPGWYRHLFSTARHPLERWMALSAGVLRAHDLPTSTAHVIDSVRLARTLAHLRDRPEPGLTEVIDATRAVLCEGNDLAVDLVLRDAVVGEELGRVPDSAPMVPLESDLRATAKSLRLRFDATAKEVTLDLRAGNDLRKSELWWRLRILGVDWAGPAEVAGTGTFKEGWAVRVVGPTHRGVGMGHHGPGRGRAPPGGPSRLPGRLHRGHRGRHHRRPADRDVRIAASAGPAGRRHGRHRRTARGIASTGPGPAVRHGAGHRHRGHRGGRPGGAHPDLRGAAGRPRRPR
jgi:hypothetical protein